MTVGDLIKVLSDFCPDTQVRVLDGNLLVSDIHYNMYGEGDDVYPEIDDGEGGHPDTLYLVTD